MVQVGQNCRRLVCFKSVRTAEGLYGLGGDAVGASRGGSSMKAVGMGVGAAAAGGVPATAEKQAMTQQKKDSADTPRRRLFDNARLLLKPS